MATVYDAYSDTDGVATVTPDPLNAIRSMTVTAAGSGNTVVMLTSPVKMAKPGIGYTAIHQPQCIVMAG